jgi:hypothetical protein
LTSPQVHRRPDGSIDNDVYRGYAKRERDLAIKQACFALLAMLVRLFRLAKPTPHIKQRLSRTNDQCPLLGHKQTFAVQTVMSALPPKADMCGATRHVRFVPIADICKMDRGCVPTSGAALQLPRRRSLGSGRANPTATKRSSPPPMRALTTVSTRMSPSR